MSRLHKSHMSSKFTKGIKVRIYPTEDQKKQIENILHVTRSVYNLGLEMQNTEYEMTGQFIKYFDMITRFKEMRNNQIEFKWLQSIDNSLIRESLNRLDNAFYRFFSKQNKHPKFKSRKTYKKSFTTRSDRTHIYGEYIKISGIPSMILAKDHKIPEDVRLWNTVVSTDGYGHYWFSCTIEFDGYDTSNIPKTEPIGIDVGIVNTIAVSDGTLFRFSDTSKYQKRIKRQQRRLSKYYGKYYQQSLDTRTKYEDIPKSKNFYKLQKNLQKTINKIVNKHSTELHTATKRIVERNPSAIVIETISVKNQLHDKWIRKYSPQMMYYEIHRQIKYKAENRGIPVIMAPANYPSSQICSNCGNIGYSKHRKFKCPKCGYSEDRDINAAINLRNLAYHQI